MVIPVAAPTRLAPEERAAVREAVLAVVDAQQWVLGPSVARFERELAAYVGGGEVVGTGNGSDALCLALASLGVPPGSRVLVPPNDSGFAGQAARAVGLEPVVHDVDPVTMGPTVELLSAALVPGTAAVVVTHLHGDPLDLVAIDAWRSAEGLLLVEDCAQAHGARPDGRHVGRTGDAATFSFYPTKNLAAVGDGGALLLHDPATAERARSLREYGWGERGSVDHPRGRNSRLDELQAAVLSARLPHLDRRNARRRALLDRYRKALHGSATRVHGDPVAGVAHHAVVLDARRDALREHLHRAGVGTAVHYPHLTGEMRGIAPRGGRTAVADRQRHEKLTLPCFPELTDDEVEAVVAALEAWRDAS
ncbi:DegT/DnrJ/EryC1/StrS family aminotransferase [Oryzobacter telluris]|uniref:DegT/DnrJ/EryC1/StrS family aminotransferase n=1 Tax=Oryzobacter telluris TaxID=3149179 RepID=UPI00370DC00D